MRILILGCDTVGEQLAADLAKEDHQITVMDTDPDRLLRLPKEPHVDAVLASDSLIEDLRGVGINNIDVLLAISDNDNKNVLAAQVAKQIFQVPEVICRVGGPSATGVLRRPGHKRVLSDADTGRHYQEGHQQYALSLRRPGNQFQGQSRGGRHVHCGRRMR